MNLADTHGSDIETASGRNSARSRSVTTDYQPDMMIYHANCADGFGAAWAAWMKWGDAVEYVPCAYGQQAPEVLGKHVLIGDFSFKREQMDIIAQGAASIVVLDHHKTAESELEPFRFMESSPGAVSADDTNGMLRDLAELARPPVIAVFDMEQSGAVMTWRFCHPNTEIPLLLRLIEDRDLWRFTMPETKPFGAWLRCEPFGFERWEMIAQELNDGSDSARIFAEAEAMQRFMDQKVSEIASLGRRGIVGGYEVPICNCPPMFASEVGHKLLADNPLARFVACYSDQGKSRGWSLRSSDDRLDVSEVAKKFGGGGHRNAAGFGVPL